MEATGGNDFKLYFERETEEIRDWLKTMMQGLIEIMQEHELPLKTNVDDQIEDGTKSVHDEDVQESNTEVVVDEERLISHYSNRQKILLVGEGDFSFASCLATAFGSASNLTATSFDSRDVVIKKYSNGEKNLRNLEERGAIVIHEVDVRTMNNRLELKGKLFDRIVFNFPHAGETVETIFRVMESDSCYIECHQRLVNGFLKVARHMLRKDGEIHVTHKTAYPYEKWNVVESGNDLGLVLKKEVSFCRFDYPGYVNRKAYGWRWDDTFPVGQAATFIFARS